MRQAAAAVAVLPGDGVGPEVVDAALAVLRDCLPIEVRTGLIGAAALDATGDALPPETESLCRSSDAVLAGPVRVRRGQGPARADDSLARLQRALGVYASLRPARHMGLATPLREDLVRQADVLVVRDAVAAGGLRSAGSRSVEPAAAADVWGHEADDVRRVAELAFRLARARRRRVTSVDRADVLRSSRLWRTVVQHLGRRHPAVDLEHRYADAISFELLQVPRRFDVVLAGGVFGEILGDELAAVVGSPELVPEALLGDGPSLFQPGHGPGDRLAGRGLANPAGAILAGALLLEHGLGRPDLARAVEAAVAEALRDTRTTDLGGRATTGEFTSAVRRHLAWTRWASPAAEEHDAATTLWAV